ncbi:MAG: hypothetical protein FWH07_01875 [Oscillospiraceae bacterium]|nr:hypothetical protein [Oscillospiraceae bacterium]
MKIIKYDGNSPVDKAMRSNEPLIAAISIDGKTAVLSQIDESFEHHILLQKTDIPSESINKYFRIVFDKDGADWTFACPSNYKGISDKTRRISTFYKDGFAVISEFLAEIGYLCDITIPKRYKRHIESLE